MSHAVYRVVCLIRIGNWCEVELKLFFSGNVMLSLAMYRLVWLCGCVDMSIFCNFAESARQTETDILFASFSISLHFSFHVDSADVRRFAVTHTHGHPYSSAYTSASSISRLYFMNFRWSLFFLLTVFMMAVHQLHNGSPYKNDQLPVTATIHGHSLHATNFKFLWSYLFLHPLLAAIPIHILYTKQRSNCN